MVYQPNVQNEASDAEYFDQCSKTYFIYIATFVIANTFLMVEEEAWNMRN